MQNFHCFCVRKFLWSAVGKDADKSWFKRKVYALENKVPLERVLAYFEKMIKRYNKKRTEWVRILMFPTPNKEYGYMTKWYEHSTDISFEGTLFLGIENYDEYLTFKFGDYHILPPMEKRKSHPVTWLELGEDK